MYITVDDIKHEVSLYYPIDNRNGNREVELIHAYFVYSFYNIEKDEIIHLKNGELLKVKRGCYTMKDIEKVSSGKVKYDSLTGKSVIDPTISRVGPYMNKILGIGKWKLLRYATIKKCSYLKLTNCQPLTTYSMVNHVMKCILGTLIKKYHLVISFTLRQRIFNIKSW